MASTGEPFGLFWNSENGDRTYDASSFEYWLKKFFTSGVFNGDLQVLATSGMTLKVGPGYANADGKVRFWNAEFNLTLSPANSTYPRIDTVVITRDNVNRNITCEVVTGQYSGDTPQPTAPVRTAEIYQLVLAQIYVGNGVTEITQANITDTRPDPNLCGYITGTVTEMDFSQFTAQFESYFIQFKAQHEHEWSVWEQTQVAAYAAWFANVQAQQIADKADWDEWYADLQEELHMLPPDSAEYLQIQIDEIRENGTTGSIFHITTINSELEGKTVTVSCGTEVRTATFDENLECSVVGFKSVGAVTITSTDGIQTATSIVNIDYYSKYEIPIAFWLATVNIQGDDNLKGVTVTVKDSDNTTVDTIVLNVITGQGVFSARKADTYTFNYSYQGTDYSESLIVDEQITYSLSLSAGFNWRIWVDTAQFLDSSDYDSLDEVLADELAVRELCLEHACVDYLAAVSSVNADIETIINNDLFAKWVNNSDYALDFLGANVAIKALMDEADKYGYGEWSLVGQVPKMTSNTAPYGEVIYSSYNTNGNKYPYYAFDNTTNEWRSNNETNNSYIGYKSIDPICLKAISYVQHFSDDTPRMSTFKVQGSNTGSTDDWHDLTELVTAQYDTTDKTKQFFYTVNSSEYYLYHRVIINASITTGIQELQFYSYAPKGNVPIMTSDTAPYGTVFYSSVMSSPPSYVHSYSPFDGQGWTTQWKSNTVANEYFGYAFVNPVKVKKVRIETVDRRIKNYRIEAANTSNFSDKDILYTGIVTYGGTDKNIVLDIPLENDNYYLYYRVYVIDTQTSSERVSIFNLQFYGRELKVSVPTMTANNTPYGSVSAESYMPSSGVNWYPYQAFDKNDSTAWNAAGTTTGGESWIEYDFNSPIYLKFIHLYAYNTNGNRITHSYSSIDAYVDGSWVPVAEGESFGTDDYTKDFIVNQNNVTKIRLRGPKVAESGQYYWEGIKSFDVYGLDYSEKEFEEGTTKKWLYDHGVELETLTPITVGGTVTKNSEEILIIAATSGNTNACGVESDSMDFTNYNYMFAICGDIYATQTYEAFCIADSISSTPLAIMRPIKVPKAGMDISSINQTSKLRVSTASTNGKYSLKELWLE